MLTSTLLVLDGNGDQPVQMTCLSEALPFLSWYYDGTAIATFVFTGRVQFPHTVHNESEVLIEITSANNAAESDSFSAVSVLSTTIEALSMISVDRIQCGANQVRSQAIDLTVLEFQGVLQVSLALHCDHRSQHLFLL